MLQQGLTAHGLSDRERQTGTPGPAGGGGGGGGEVVGETHLTDISYSSMATKTWQMGEMHITAGTQEMVDVLLGPPPRGTGRAVLLQQSCHARRNDCKCATLQLSPGASCTPLVGEAWQMWSTPPGERGGGGGVHADERLSVFCVAKLACIK